ncbi:hypothetical protein MMC30_005193 [Trapelia coarctata]|nr:hypothetical protein [Trapelia coarctata]
MPTKAPSTRALRSLRSYLGFRPFICPSCRHNRPASTVAAAATTTTTRASTQWSNYSPKHLKPLRRRVASITPVTAVNVPRTIPAANLRLYEELTALEKKAATFVHLSQLQLALRGLESEDPIIRVAVLGLNGRRGARRLIRALLADPLGPEQPWEGELVGRYAEDGRALLIRYGKDYELDQRHPLLRTLSVPSTLLENNKIELLVYSIDSGLQNEASGMEIDSQDLLVPAIETPISASGRASMISYPVHKALVFGEGVQGILAMPRAAYLGGDENTDSMIKGAVNAGWQPPEALGSPEESIALTNLPQAESAIASFRNSVNNSFDYEHKWLASNLPTLIDFLSAGTKPTPVQALKPALHGLISTILKETTSAVSLAHANRLAAVASSAVPDRTRTNLSEAITKWAEAAHIELRDGLALAFASPAWRKTAWWKLLWRVDDVGFMAAQILQRSFLIEAEKEIIWIGGRMQQAGLLSPLPEPQKRKMPKQALGADPPAPHISDLLAPSASVEHDLYVLPKPIIQTSRPQQIALARADLLACISPLQALAQTLLLQSLSTTILTSALSALMYVSISTTSIYVAGVVGTLGFVWSARRLQREWERARGEWRGRVMEEGRRVLGATEGELRQVVVEGGRETGDRRVEEEEERGAGEAVEAVRECLEGLKREREG